MIHRIVIELTDELGGYEEELEHLERVYGAEELPQGKWKNVGFMVCECNNCKEQFHELEANNYCPNCGAKMT